MEKIEPFQIHPLRCTDAMENEISL